MKQLILDLSVDTQPSFETFAGQNNRELLHVLQGAEEPCLYIWGGAGVGKTHLLRSYWTSARLQGLKSLYVGKDKNLLCHLQEETYDCVVVDDVHLCNEIQAGTLFTLFNHWREAGVRLLFAADVPPRALPLREDVCTRMGWCTVYEVRPLSDDEKMQVLRTLARSRQMYADEEIYRYLLLHGKRDLPTLVKTLTRFDDFALGQGRRMTLPLFKQFLQQEDT